MIELMKKYNKLCKRFADAEVYFAREDVSLIEKQGQAGNTKKLVDEMQATMDAITAKDYILTEDEKENGFRQIQYLSKNNLI